jgi:hypothetical protein
MFEPLLKRIREATTDAELDAMVAEVRHGKAFGSFTKEQVDRLVAAGKERRALLKRAAEMVPALEKQPPPVAVDPTDEPFSAALRKPSISKSSLHRPPEPPGQVTARQVREMVAHYRAQEDPFAEALQATRSGKLLEDLQRCKTVEAAEGVLEAVKASKGRGEISAQQAVVLVAAAGGHRNRLKARELITRLDVQEGEIGEACRFLCLDISKAETTSDAHTRYWGALALNLTELEDHAVQAVFEKRLGEIAREARRAGEGATQ